MLRAEAAAAILSKLNANAGLLPVFLYQSLGLTFPQSTALVHEVFIFSIRTV